MSGIDPQLLQWFQMVDTDRTGMLNFEQLCYALRNGDNTAFRPETCRLMVNMFDQDGNGQIDINEFQQIMGYLNQWRMSFDSFDSRRSGGLDAGEAHQAFVSMGYQVSAQFVQQVLQKMDVERTQSLRFDDFVRVCCLMQTLGAQFSQLDVYRQGFVNMTYAQVLMMICNSSF